MDLHRQRDRRVVADKNKNLRDAVSAQDLFYLGKSRVRYFGACDQCGGEIVNATLVRVRKLRIGAGHERVDGLLRQAHALALTDMGLADVVAVPMPCDHQDADLDLARRQRAALVEKGADVLHSARKRRAVDPHFVRSENSPATGDELVEDGRLLGRQPLRWDFKNAIHRVPRLFGGSLIVLLKPPRARSGATGVSPAAE